MDKNAVLSTQKLRGGYYTPEKIVSFLCKWAITKKTQRILEPSCGDGHFISGALTALLSAGVAKKELASRITGVELFESEAKKARLVAKAHGTSDDCIVHSDFFEYLLQHRNDRYDVVLGNPPFIRYQNFPPKHREIAISMMQELGLNPNKLTNIWVPFLVVASSLLNAKGKLGMVIPAELFQVKYAAETRIFLSNFFKRITIVSFKKLVFENIQQEVVLLLCEKEATENIGIRVVELDTLDDLDNVSLQQIQQSPAKSLEHDSEKWTKYFLDESEIQFLRAIKLDPRIRLGKELMDVNVGLVTGRNDFFMINEETASKWKIKPYTIKVVSRSNHFKGLIFTDRDFEDNAVNNIEGYLFLPPDKDFDALPKACRDYIAYGESMDYHTGYKCKIRKRWYITPSLYRPGGFALRQVGEFPKLIVNDTEAASTDTIHRVRFKPDINPKLVTLSFLNSLSFAFSEITGRSYGGGVLTFEPTEVGEIPLPMLLQDTVGFSKIDRLIRQRKIETVLDIIDHELLIKQLKFTRKEVATLRNIWRKLSDRRQNRR